MKRERSIKPVVKIVKFSDQKGDAAYWRTQPYAARIAALEELRTEYHQWKYHTQSGFQRVLRIIKR